MFRTRFLCLLLALVCIVSMGSMALAAEVDCDTTYCFTSTDFSDSDMLRGVCITKLPEANTGTVMLGCRVIRSGDILTAEQLAQMTFHPLRTEENQDAVVTYLPIYENRVDPHATMTISIRGKQDKSPVAEDFALETYKNLPNEAKLKANDPEGEALTYTMVRGPKRGEVAIAQDGTFTYTPKKNKVGVDSFTYTAADPAGNVSREATVTIQILKPTDAKQYTDTVGDPCRFAAEWMRNTGLFEGERINGQSCFQPDETVSRGEFVSMLVQMLQIPTEEVSYEGIPADAPDWLKPYWAAALRSGLTDGLPADESGSFLSCDPVTGAEAAVMLQNVLDLTTYVQTMESVEISSTDGKVDIPTWAAGALNAMADNGILFAAEDTMTRRQMAQVLYQVSKMADSAPGMAVIRMNQS